MGPPDGDLVQRADDLTEVVEGQLAYLEEMRAQAEEGSLGDVGEE